MKKIKAFSIGNINEFSYIVVEKSENFFKFLEDWLYKSFPKGNFEEISTYEDEKDDCKHKKKIVSKYEDVHEFYSSEGIRIDIFFGKKRVFITIYTSLKNREKLMNDLEKYVQFIKYRKSKFEKKA